MSDSSRQPSQAPPPSVWVVIAAYNEAGKIGEVVREVIAAGWPVVVVDDGSADDTYDRAAEAGAHSLRHAINRGQGAALQTGFDFAQAQGAEVVVTFDADGQHCCEDIPTLVAALLEDGVDVALGSRFLGTVDGASKLRHAFLRASTRISNIMSGLSLTDAHCGIRAIRSSALDRLRITQDGMAHASQILHAIRHHEISYKEVPVTIRYSEYSRAKGQSPLNAVRILFDHFYHRARSGE